MVGSTKGRGVFSSINKGKLITTFDPLRSLMLDVKVLMKRFSVILDRRVDIITNGKRACGLVISSGKKRLWLEIPLEGSQYGSVNTPRAPKRGNEVKVIGTSLGFKCLRTRFRLQIVTRCFRLGSKRS